MTSRLGPWTAPLGLTRTARRRAIKSAACVATSIAVTLTATACSSGGSGPSDGANSTINVGTITALTGPNAALSSQARGIQAYFSNIDAQGGINGHQIKVFVGNDQFNPALTPGVASQLVGKDHVQMMCGIAGSADAAAIKPFLASQKVADVAPASGSPDLVIPPTPTEYEVIPAYEPLTADLVKYAVNVLHKKKIAIAYTSDDVGLPALAGAKYELKQLHLKLVAQVQFSLTATSLAPQAAQLKASGADFVILWHVAAPFALLVNNANQIGFHPTWGGGFFASTPSFVALTKGITNDNAYFASPFNSTTAANSASYRAAMAKYQPKTSTQDINAMQGWTLADACANLIKQTTAGGKSFTSDNLTAAAQKMSLNDTYVHNLTWTPQSHTGITTAEILKQENGKFVAVTSYQQLPPAPTNAG